MQINQPKQDAIMQKHGAFYAFGQSQFDERKEAGKQYVSICSGLICPKDTADEFVTELEQLIDEAIAKDLAENGKEKIIERELLNHEISITHNLQPTFEALNGYNITLEEIRSVYLKMDLWQ